MCWTLIERVQKYKIIWDIHNEDLHYFRENKGLGVRFLIYKHGYMVTRLHFDFHFLWSNENNKYIILYYIYIIIYI